MSVRPGRYHRNGSGRRRWSRSAGRANDAVERARRAAADQHAVVVLMELVAELRVGEEIGEVVVEIERALDHIGVAAPRAAIVGLLAIRADSE